MEMMSIFYLFSSSYALCRVGSRRTHSDLRASISAFLVKFDKIDLSAERKRFMPDHEDMHSDMQLLCSHICHVTNVNAYDAVRVI